MWKFAIRNLLSRPLRSLLSLLGLTVAIMGMVGLFSVAHGFDQQLQRTFGQIPGLAAMQPGAPIPIFSKLPADWREEIAEVEGVSVVTSEIWQRINVINQKMIVSPPRFWFGYDIEHSVQLEDNIYERSIEKGRPLKLEDRGTRNCLISLQIAEEFQVGVGDSLAINDHLHQIVGIYQTGSLMLDMAVVVDMEEVRRMTGFASDSVTSFYIEPKPDADKEKIAKRIRDKFRGRELPAWKPTGWMLGDNPIESFSTWIDRRLKSWQQKQKTAAGKSPSSSGGNASTNEPHRSPSPSASSEAESIEPFMKVERDMPIQVRTAQEWGRQFDKYAEDLDLLLILLTGIGVTIAVLSIVNTMVMSVTERIIEIGILKANGWSRTDVLKLITFESALIGLGGGLLGSFLGWVGTLIVNWNWPERVELYAGPSLLSFSVAFAVVLGILGGLYPAFWAMRMMPMDAIRRG